MTLLENDLLFKILDYGEKNLLVITVLDNLFWCVGSVDIFGIILYKK